MGVLQEGIAGAEQEHRTEQIPLDLQESVGANAEGLARDRVGGADQGGGEHQPDDQLAEQATDGVDDAGERSEERRVGEEGGIGWSDNFIATTNQEIMIL